MALTPEQQGKMVCSMLGLLPFLGDALDPNMNSLGCCPTCCLPCSVLEELDRAGTLDEVVQWAPRHNYATLAWWRDGKVDRTWLYGVWACPNQCERDTNDTPTLEWVLDRLQRHFKVGKGVAIEMLRDRLVYEDTLSDDPAHPILAQL